MKKKYMICALEELKKCKLCNHRRKNLISVVSKENKSITKEDIFNSIRRLVLLEIME
ncbi:hypothetical protein [uncultured Clostridium sp.]|uniref:hypothetical protein n=1 Tax=uncultured Clostridium sp. TaxID=59620 RepID=UPI0027DC7E5C|nr:hypothetical protein [uncultured Clostridium sp.]